MNSKNNKVSDHNRLLLNLTDKIDYRRKDKYIAISNLSNYYTWKDIQKSYEDNKFKISAPPWVIIFCMRYYRLFQTFIKNALGKDS